MKQKLFCLWKYKKELIYWIDLFYHLFWWEYKAGWDDTILYVQLQHLRILFLVKMFVWFEKNALKQPWVFSPQQVTLTCKK